MLDFTVELSRTNELLERIAVALERAVGPVEVPAEPRPPRRTEPQDIGRTRSAEDIAMERVRRAERMLR